MKANKVTVTIKMEALSIDVLDGLLAKAAFQINQEMENGMLVADDGDQIKWTVKREPVEF